MGMVRADSIASECGSGVWGADGVRVGRRALMPLPSALRGFSVLLMSEYLFGEFDIAFGAPGAGVVAKDGLAETGCLRQPDAARDHGLEDLVVEEFLKVSGNLAGEVVPV